MEEGCRGIEHYSVFMAAWAGGCEVEFFEVGALALLVGGFTLGAIELVDLGVAAGVMRSRLGSRGLVFEGFEAQPGGDWVGTIGVAVSFVGGVVFVVGT